MKKILCLLLAVITVLAVCTACTRSSSSLYKSDAWEKTEKIKKLTEVDKVDGTISDGGGSLGLFVTAPSADGKATASVYNFKKNTVVFSRTAENPEQGIYLLGFDLYAVYTAAEKEGKVGTWTVYKASSEKALTSFNTDFLFVNDDLLYVAHQVYRLSDGSVKKTDVVWNGKDIPGTRYNEKYYYDMNSVGSGSYSVYDLGGNMIDYYLFPTYATLKNAFVLNSGSVLLQYAVKVGTKADDNGSRIKYDFEEDNGTLYTLHSFIRNPENGKMSAVKVNGVIRSVRTEYYLAVDNLARFVPIDGNKRIDTNDTRLVVLSNHGAVDEIKLLNNAQTDFTTPAGKDAWWVTTNNGYMLYSKSGKLLATISAEGGYWIGEEAFLNDKTIRNYKGEILLDLTAENLTVSSYSAQNFTLRDSEGNRYLFADGKLNDFLMNSTEDVVLQYDFMIVTRSVTGTTATYTLYNYKGDKLETLKGNYSIEFGYVGKDLFITASDSETGKTTIYKASK